MYSPRAIIFTALYVEFIFYILYKPVAFSYSAIHFAAVTHICPRCATNGMISYHLILSIQIE